MNPRDQDPVSGGNPRGHMILRRGLTFDHTQNGEHPRKDKGLMFACYQSSIRMGFEFLASQWANRRSRPRNDPGGMDLLIGQRPATSGGARSLTLVGANDERYELETTEEWVTPTGGEYFFVPSISAIDEVLTR